MFIIMVGLLGVAAMLPVGKLEIAAGARVDRAGGVGRAAFRELKTRRIAYTHPVTNQTTRVSLLDPRAWVNAEGTPFYSPVVYPTATANDAMRPYILRGDAVNAVNTRYDTPFGYSFEAFSRWAMVVIDPLGVGDGAPASSGSLGGWFPYHLRGSGGWRQPRLTIGQGLTTSARMALAEEIFRSQDDAQTTVSTDKDNPPISQMNATFSKRQAQGEYSWLATVSADPGIGANNLLTVSVVVFYRRPLSLDPDVNTGVPQERYINVANSSTLTLLYSTAGSVDLILQGTKDFTDVKNGQWLMLAGYYNTSPQQWRARWYRVVSVGEFNSPANNQRRVTLVGPEWQQGMVNQGCYICDGVVGVYEKNMRLEELVAGD